MSSPTSLPCKLCSFAIGQPTPSDIIEYCVSLPCNHVFGNKCIDTWLRENANCPTCGAECASDFVATFEVLREAVEAAERMGNGAEEGGDEFEEVGEFEKVEEQDDGTVHESLTLGGLGEEGWGFRDLGDEENGGAEESEEFIAIIGGQTEVSEEARDLNVEQHDIPDGAEEIDGGSDEAVETISEETIEIPEEAIGLRAEENATADETEQTIEGHGDVEKAAIADEPENIKNFNETIAGVAAIVEEVQEIEEPESVEEVITDQENIADRNGEIEATANINDKAAETAEAINGTEEDADDTIGESLVDDTTLVEEFAEVDAEKEDFNLGKVSQDEAAKEETVEEEVVEEEVAEETAVVGIIAAETNAAEENGAEDAEEFAQDTTQELDPAFQAARNLHFQVEHSLGYNDQYRTNLEASRTVAGRSTRILVSKFNTSTRPPPEGLSKALVSSRPAIWAQYLHSLRLASLEELKATRAQNFRVDIVRYYEGAREEFFVTLDKILEKKNRDGPDVGAVEAQEAILKANDADKIKELEGVVESLADLLN